MKVNVKALISIPFIISAAVAMTGCRTVPQNSQDMTCEDLNYLADEAVETKGVPFFLSQLQYPGDWRTCSETPEFIDWIKNESRRRIHHAGKDWGELVMLRYFAKDTHQEEYKVRAVLGECLKPKPTKEITLHFIELHPDANDKPFTVEANLTGQRPQDKAARILCGYETYPAKSKTDDMAARWKSCQIKGKPE
ncbi:hypothetical protein [Turicimonas muris]|uniref:Lipoprotein n=1 Tax=Turicimonas muris TaxID=1796652 RepID=A0A227KS32_9BURK|nr:hypothetical protein [Turicimonas muris]ANU65510.1 hypothetical protein A4V04_02995 [Burkholderiales bacterium YL45]MBS4769003.1 hypothetical protein [Burkholderiales bacterium]OXE51322.1 hypothetical protein ADH67_03235 [Turicimonas muris]QQQ96657.1 hypothetical protein I5Q81_12105 [Turicimonas muris]